MESTRHADARAVHHSVEAPETIGGRLCRAVAQFRPRDVARSCNRLPSGGNDPVRLRASRGFIQVGDHDAGTVAGDPSCNFGADASGAAEH